MALCRALADGGARGLVVISFLGSADVELLLEAACIAELHSAGVGLDAAGLAPRYRAARERDEVRFVEWSEGALLAALEAGGRGLDTALTRSGLGTDLLEINPWLREVPDPHTGAPVVAARALAPDLALLHVPAADARGNLYVDGDLAADGLLARAARRTVASFELEVEADPAAVAISRLWVDAVVRTPGGSAPTACFPDRPVDLAAIGRLASVRP
jgi:glutaconate CoA-transferase subunit A